jgi:hypothetical protein
MKIQKAPEGFLKKAYEQNTYFYKRISGGAAKSELADQSPNDQIHRTRHRSKPWSGYIFGDIGLFI